jgi:hypothetical protein
LAHSERAFQARSNFLLTGTHYATQAVRTLCSNANRSHQKKARSKLCGSKTYCHYGIALI